MTIKYNSWMFIGNKLRLCKKGWWKDDEDKNDFIWIVTVEAPKGTAGRGKVYAKYDSRAAFVKTILGLAEQNENTWIFP